MRRVLVKHGEIVKVEDLGKRLKDAKEALRRQKISNTLKARSKEKRDYSHKLDKLISHWRGTVK